MTAESMPDAPAPEGRVQRSKGGFNRHRPLIFAALALAGAAGQAHAAPTPDPAISEEVRTAQAVEESDQASAADRLRDDPLDTAPVPPEATAKPVVVNLTKDERAVARHITRSYRIDSGSSERFVHYAYKAAREFRLDPHLILAVMAVESRFDANARSTAGAKGLMQVHVKVHSSKFEPYGGADAVYDPPANIKVGAGILSGYVNRYGDVAAGLKAYVGAALLPSDGGYGSKVLNRQAEFDAVLRPEAPARKVSMEAKLEDPEPAVSLDAESAEAGSPGADAL